MKGLHLHTMRGFVLVACVSILLLAGVAAAASHQREMRGVWVASVSNIDWPLSSTLSVAEQRASLLKLFDAYEAQNLNAVFFHARPEGDALYPSAIEPWSRWLTGKQGTPPSPIWDPLQFAITEAHKRNMQLHAWINPYRARMDKRSSLAPSHIASRFPQYAYDYGTWTWMDPGAQPVMDNSIAVIRDMLERYDLDGIHMDDYFYPYKVQGEYFPDNKTYADYVSTGGRLALDDWRRDNVNRFIVRAYEETHRVRPTAQFSISPFGIWRPGYPATVAGLDAYAELFADSRKWLANGWVDFLAPQLYWEIKSPNQSFPLLFDWWHSVSREHSPARHVYSGNALYRHKTSSWPLEELGKQVSITRGTPNSGCLFFSGVHFLDSDVAAYFPTAVYPTPALPPSMPWLDTRQPVAPSGFRCDKTAAGGAGRVLRWSLARQTSVRSWSVYQDSKIWRILSADKVTVSPAAGAERSYSLCAVSETAVESACVSAMC